MQQDRHKERWLALACKLDQCRTVKHKVQIARAAIEETLRNGVENGQIGRRLGSYTNHSCTGLPIL